MNEPYSATSVQPPRRSSGLIAVMTCIALVIIAVISIAVFVKEAQHAFSQESTQETPQDFTVASGETAAAISSELSADHEIPSAFWMNTYMRLHPQYATIDAGTYLIPAHATIRDIAIQLHAPAQQQTLRVTEGATVNDIASDIAAIPSLGITEADVISAERQLAGSYSFLGQHIDGSQNQQQSLEGYLFPDTYYVKKGMTAADILNLLLANESNKFTPGMIAEAESQHMTVRQVIILASLIEKEVGSTGTVRDPQTLQAERQTVAGILYNRLNDGMRLQLDSTKNYIQPGASQPDPSYDTYVIAGLPPGPICNPSLDSLLAVLSPTHSDYLYFITDKQGTAHFAATIQQQDANIAEYLR